MVRYLFEIKDFETVKNNKKKNNLFFFSQTILKEMGISTYI